MLVDGEKNRFVYDRVVRTPSSSPVTHLVSTLETEPDGPRDSARVAVANNSGDGYIYSGAAMQTLAWKFEGAGIPITSVVLRGEDFIAGYASGLIRIFNVTCGTVRVEIAAHSRTLNAIAVHPLLPILVSVGEDTYMNIWDIQGMALDEVQLIRSESFPHSLLSGVAFDQSGTNIFTVAYDLPVLNIRRVAS